MKLDLNAAFPGGNILVDGIENNTVSLRQDWQSSSEWWFYWHFRVRGAQGQTWRFQFTDGDVFGAAGPCVYLESGWQWLGRDVIRDNAFEYTFGVEESEVAFAFCPPYVETHLQDFLRKQAMVERNVLCFSEENRPVEHLTIQSRHGYCSAIFTARTHACETMANFVLEGMVEGWLTLPEASYMRENIDLHAIPFMDKDGVEKGEQGKCRKPHDHNRDFTSAPIYNSTRALMEQMQEQKGRCVFFLDMHCPWIRGGRNEELFFLGLPPGLHPRLERFMDVLHRTQRGPLSFTPRHTIMPGQEWYSEDAPTAGRWAREALSPHIATTLEVPYAVAGGQIMNTQNARAFGYDLCRALAKYFESELSSQP